MRGYRDVLLRRTGKAATAHGHLATAQASHRTAEQEWS